jgi:superfamily II DNA/RNA helicase
VPEDYIHRIGRTGRAGKTGEAVSLVCVDEHKLLSDIERLLKRKIPQVVIPNFEPNPAIVPQPLRMGRRTTGRGNPGRGNGPRNTSPHAPKKKFSDKRFKQFKENKPSRHFHQKRDK